MGYYIHLFTDYLWEQYFVTEIVKKNSIKLIDGGSIEATKENYKKLIYNDYTNLNQQLIDLYKLDTKLFYDEPFLPDVTMDEIPIDKLGLLLIYSRMIVENTKLNKSYIFNVENIIKFIDVSSDIIYSEIKILLNDLNKEIYKSI